MRTSNPHPTLRPGASQLSGVQQPDEAGLQGNEAATSGQATGLRAGPQDTATTGGAQSLFGRNDSAYELASAHPLDSKSTTILPEDGQEPAEAGGAGGPSRLDIIDPATGVTGSPANVSPLGLIPPKRTISS